MNATRVGRSGNHQQRAGTSGVASGAAEGGGWPASRLQARPTAGGDFADCISFAGFAACSRPIGEETILMFPGGNHTMRQLFFLAMMMVSLSSLGCCSPCGFGPGCAALDGGCQDCEGGFGPRALATGPLDAIRQAKRSLVCGGGCGEVYYGEWISTPPYATDPCGDAGCAVRCAPFCWSPGALLPGALISGLYGKRFADDCGTGDCGCGDCFAGDCDSCGGSVLDSGAPVSAGCASCASGGLARQVPARSQGAPAARQANTRGAAPATGNNRPAARTAQLNGMAPVRASTSRNQPQLYR